MTAAELLLKYVGEHGWYSVANIFHDNEFSHQPHSNNGFICASPSLECLFTTGTIDAENTPIIERRYVVSPYRCIGFEQTITVLPFDHLQRFDCLLFELPHHYNGKGPEADFPIPTIPTPGEIEAIKVDPETGLAEGYPIAVLTDRIHMDKKLNEEDGEKGATQISVIDLHPDHPEWSNNKFMGLRIMGVKEFIANQKLFCQRMNTMFNVSDCI